MPKSQVIQIWRSFLNLVSQFNPASQLGLQITKFIVFLWYFHVFYRIETINRARDQCRVKACIWMMILCVGGCIIQIVRGKRAAERGESVTQANIDWHQQYNEAAKKDANQK